MIEMGARECQGKFWALLKGIEAVRIIGRNGVVLGTLYPAVCDAVEEEAAILDEDVQIAKRLQNGMATVYTGDEVNPILEKSTFESLKKKFDTRQTKIPDVVDRWAGKPLCYFCPAKNAMIAEYKIMHEEGTGYEERLACHVCFKKSKSTNFTKL